MEKFFELKKIREYVDRIIDINHEFENDNYNEVSNLKNEFDKLIEFAEKDIFSVEDLEEIEKMCMRYRNYAKIYEIEEETKKTKKVIYDIWSSFYELSYELENYGRDEGIY